jgi:hypothetical protein
MDRRPPGRTGRVSVPGHSYPAWGAQLHRRFRFATKLSASLRIRPSSVGAYTDISPVPTRRLCGPAASSRGDRGPGAAAGPARPRARGHRGPGDTAGLARASRGARRERIPGMARSARGGKGGRDRRTARSAGSVGGSVGGPTGWQVGELVGWFVHLRGFAVKPPTSGLRAMASSSTRAPLGSRCRETAHDRLDRNPSRLAVGFPAPSGPQADRQQTVIRTLAIRHRLFGTEQSVKSARPRARPRG